MEFLPQVILRVENLHPEVQRRKEKLPWRDDDYHEGAWIVDVLIRGIPGTITITTSLYRFEEKRTILQRLAHTCGFPREYRSGELLIPLRGSNAYGERIMVPTHVYYIVCYERIHDGIILNYCFPPVISRLSEPPSVLVPVEIVMSQKKAAFREELYIVDPLKEYIECENVMRKAGIYQRQYLDQNDVFIPSDHTNCEVHISLDQAFIPVYWEEIPVFFDRNIGLITLTMLSLCTHLFDELHFQPVPTFNKDAAYRLLNDLMNGKPPKITDDAAEFVEQFPFDHDFFVEPIDLPNVLRQPWLLQQNKI